MLQPSGESSNTIDGDEGVVRMGRIEMDGAGDPLFACSGLSGNEYGGLVLRQDTDDPRE